MTKRKTTPANGGENLLRLGLPKGSLQEATFKIIR